MFDNDGIQHWQSIFMSNNKISNFFAITLIIYIFTCEKLTINKGKQERQKTMLNLIMVKIRAMCASKNKMTIT